MSFLLSFIYDLVESAFSSGHWFLQVFQPLFVFIGKGTIYLNFVFKTCLSCSHILVRILAIGITLISFLNIFLKFLLNLLQYCFCFMFCFIGPEACGILAPRPGIEPTPPALEGEVLTTGPPGKSLRWTFLKFCIPESQTTMTGFAFICIDEL